MKDLHTQCRLRKSGSDRETTTWLPKKFAVVGFLLKLKNAEDGAWENGWEVVETFQTRTSAEVAERSQDYKKQRVASDI